MKKYVIFFLSVLLLGITGCGTSRNTINEISDKQVNEVSSQIDTESEKVKTESTEEAAKEETEVNETMSKETEVSEANSSSEKSEEAPIEEQPKKETINQNEFKKEQSNKEELIEEQPKQEEKKQEESKEVKQVEEQPKQEDNVVGYNPNRVVSLAIAKCEAGGMITTEKDLKNLLDDGKITKEEYDEYYPLDGLDDSYYSVFVNVNLNKAATTSGRLLRSEEEIADYIAGMLLLESSPIFNIRNIGTYETGGETFYEFRCYR